MRILPFCLDFSRQARLIRCIRWDMTDASILEDLARMMNDAPSRLSIDHVREIWTRSEIALKSCPDPHMRGLLDDMLRQARWQVQSWHRQYRYT